VNPTTTTCPRCGIHLLPHEVHALCDRCLLIGGKRPAPPRARRASFRAPSVEELAVRFPHLDVLELVGQGGMGAVYRCRQPRLDRLVALKVLRPESADDRAFTERFLREARVLAKLDHPGIVRVHDFGVEGELHWLLMEYVDGSNLREVLDLGKLPAKDTLSLVPQACDALQYAHDHGVVHRDIKPENLLLDSHGRLRIVDFGLARLDQRSADDARLTGTHEVFGTPRYMAPEQLEGARAVDHRADIYALGAVFYELLTGELPLGRFEAPSKRVAGLDARLDEVVMCALEKAPERRYQQASELRRALGGLESADIARPVSAPPPQEHGPTSDGPAELAHPMHVTLIGAGFVLGALALSFIGIDRRQDLVAMLALAIPGCAVGAVLARRKPHRIEVALALLILFCAFNVLAFSAMRTQTGWTGLGFVCLVAGVAQGHYAERAARRA
jgi:tRNA A-37 threonylcarbamoyl transferase component Bud32